MTISLPSTSLLLKSTIDANMNLVPRNFLEKMRGAGKGPGVGRSILVWLSALIPFSKEKSPMNEVGQIFF